MLLLVPIKVGQGKGYENSSDFTYFSPRRVRRLQQYVWDHIWMCSDDWDHRSCRIELRFDVARRTNFFPYILFLSNCFWFTVAPLYFGAELSPEHKRNGVQ